MRSLELGKTKPCPKPIKRGAKAGFSTSSHAGVVALKKRSPQENKRNAEIDHEPGDIDERCYEGPDRSRIRFRTKGSIEPGERPEGDDTYEGGAHRPGNQHPMLAVVEHAELLPQRDPNHPNEAEDGTKH